MILTFAAPQIAVFALQFGPLETCALILMGLTCLSSVSANNQFKGLAMGVLGLLLACVGMSPFSAESRFTFDIFALNSGIDLVGSLSACSRLPKFWIASNGCGARPAWKTAPPAGFSFHPSANGGAGCPGW